MEWRPPPKPKIKIPYPPYFDGTDDPKAYIRWEAGMDDCFRGRDLSESKKIEAAITGFEHHAARWWDNHCSKQVWYNYRPIASWKELKEVMRIRYAPLVNWQKYSREYNGATYKASHPSVNKKPGRETVKMSKVADEQKFIQDKKNIISEFRQEKSAPEPAEPMTEDAIIVEKPVIEKPTTGETEVELVTSENSQAVEINEEQSTISCDGVEEDLSTNPLSVISLSDFSGSKAKEVTPSMEIVPVDSSQFGSTSAKGNCTSIPILPLSVAYLQDSRTNLFKEGENDANPQRTMGLIPSFDNHYIEYWNKGFKCIKHGVGYNYFRRRRGRQWASPQSHRANYVEAHKLFKDDGRLRPKFTNGQKCKLSWKEVLGQIPIKAKLKDQNAISAF